MRNRKRWTQEDVEDLKRLFPNMTAKELAVKFNCTEYAIICKCHKLGLRKINYTKPGKRDKTRCKCVHQFDLDGNYIQKWDSIQNASMSLGIQSNSISCNCRGIYSQAGNYIWSFDNDESKIKENISKRRQDVPDLMGEEWRDVVGFEGSYKVSNFGRIKSVARLKQGKNTFFTSKPKIITPHTNGIGYLKVALQLNNISHQMFVHRLVAEAFIPNPDNLPQVNHKDENKQNNVVSNLEWCTARYNVRYSINRRKK